MEGHVGPGYYSPDCSGQKSIGKSAWSLGLKYLLLQSNLHGTKGKKEKTRVCNGDGEDISRGAKTCRNILVGKDGGG